MNNEKILLPNFVIADLFKRHLIEPWQEIRPEVQLTQMKEGEISGVIKYLGDNRKKIAVLVSDATSKFIKDDELNLLTKILNACNLTLVDIAIINVYEKNIFFDEIIMQLKAEYLLLPGVDPADIRLPFSIPIFQVQQFSNCRILCAPPLRILLADSKENVALKRQLWTSLQKLFIME